MIKKIPAGDVCKLDEHDECGFLMEIETSRGRTCVCSFCAEELDADNPVKCDSCMRHFPDGATIRMEVEGR